MLGTGGRKRDAEGSSTSSWHPTPSASRLPSSMLRPSPGKNFVAAVVREGVAEIRDGRDISSSDFLECVHTPMVSVFRLEKQGGHLDAAPSVDQYDVAGGGVQQSPKSKLAMKRSQKPKGKGKQFPEYRTCGAKRHRTGPKCPQYHAPKPTKLTEKRNESLARNPSYFHKRTTMADAGGKHHRNLEKLEIPNFKKCSMGAKDSARMLRSAGFLPSSDPRSRACRK